MSQSIKTWVGSGQLWYATAGTEGIRGCGYTKELAILDYLTQLAKHNE